MDSSAAIAQRQAYVKWFPPCKYGTSTRSTWFGMGTWLNEGMVEKMCVVGRLLVCLPWEHNEVAASSYV